MIDSEDELLQRIFGTISMDAFFAEYWEKQAFHVSRNDEDQFSRYICIADVEELISNTALHFPDAQLSGGPGNLTPEHYLDANDRIVPTRFIQAYADGATIVLSKVHGLHAPLSHLKRTMESALALECQTNVYLSPAGQSGFNPHYDSHDVLILQVQGSKTFRFYAGGPYLPYASERFVLERDLPGSETNVVHLEPGDTLYIPRGMMHDAIAHNAGPSLHITLGVYAVTWLDVLNKLLSQMTSEQRQLRQSVPRTHWLDESVVSLFADDSWKVLSAVKPVQMQTAVNALRDEIALSSTSNCTGLLQRLTSRKSITPKSRLHVLPGRIISTSKASNTLIVRCHGQILEFHEPFISGVELLFSKGEIAVQEWVDLDVDQQRALAGQLLRENLVEIV